MMGMKQYVEKQSCNPPEDIFVSETMSTHVAHAGLKLTMVAEDDLELATPLSLLPSAKITTAFYVVLGMNLRLYYASTLPAEVHPTPAPEPLLIIRAKNNLSYYYSIKRVFPPLVPPNDR